MDATFDGIEIWRATCRFRFRFKHSLADRTETETVLVSLRTSGGAVGWGQALPRSYLTGENIDSVIEDIRERWWPSLSGMTFSVSSGPGPLVEQLTPLFLKADAMRRNASYAAVDVAAVAAVTAARNGERTKEAPLPRIPLTGVIPAVSPRKASVFARALKLMKYGRFKVKVGGEERADDVRLSAVRKVVGEEACLLVDANAAWGFEEGMERMERMRRFGVSLYEEPFSAAAATGVNYRDVERLLGIRVMLDESLCTLGDANAVLEAGSPSVWNVRLGKNGGFAGMGALTRLAEKHGVGVYQGILVGETSAMAAAAETAAALYRPETLEYGFPRVFIKGDPFRGGPGGFSGYINAYPEAVSHITAQRNILEKFATSVYAAKRT